MLHHVRIRMFEQTSFNENTIFLITRETSKMKKEHVLTLVSPNSGPNALPPLQKLFTVNQSSILQHCFRSWSPILHFKNQPL